MIGVLQHRVRDLGRRPHAFERRHAAGPTLRAVHAARIELHHALGVGQAAVSDARVLGIEFDDVDAGDERLEDVGAAVISRKARATQVSLPSCVYLLPLADEMTTGFGLALQDGGSTVGAWREAETRSSGAGTDEVTSIESGWHAPECTIAGLQGRRPRSAALAPRPRASPSAPPGSGDRQAADASHVPMTSERTMSDSLSSPTASPACTISPRTCGGSGTATRAKCSAGWITRCGG